MPKPRHLSRYNHTPCLTLHSSSPWPLGINHTGSIDKTCNSRFTHNSSPRIGPKARSLQANGLNSRIQLSRRQPSKLSNPGKCKGSGRDRDNAGLERPNTIMSLRVNRTAFIMSKTRHSKRIRPRIAPIIVRISKPIQLTLNTATSCAIRCLTPGWTISYRLNPSLRFKEPSKYGRNRTCLVREGMLFLVLQ